MDHLILGHQQLAKTLDCSQNLGKRRTRTGSKAAVGVIKEFPKNHHQSTSHNLSRLQIISVHSQLKSENRVLTYPA